MQFLLRTLDKLYILQIPEFYVTHNMHFLTIN